MPSKLARIHARQGSSKLRRTHFEAPDPQDSAHGNPDPACAAKHHSDSADRRSLATALSLLSKTKPLSKAVIIEALLAWFVLFSIGISYFYNFVMHVFFGEMVAHFIGWADSPFQREVGFASLGFAVVGLLAFRGSFDLRLAAIVGPAFFLFGAAGGHIYEIIQTGNLAPCYAGAILYTDIALPVICFILLWLHYRSTHNHPAQAMPPHAGTH